MNKKDIGSFVGITGVHLSNSPLGWEISAEFRYTSPKDNVMTLSLKLPNETKLNHTFVGATVEKIISKKSSAFLIQYWDLSKNDKITLEGKLEESKTIFSFFFRPEEIISD